MSYPNYRGSLLTSGSADEASVSFHFASRTEAEAFHEAAIALVEGRGQSVTADSVIGYLPAPLTHSQAWPQGYVDGFNDCAQLAEEQVRIALIQLAGMTA